MHQALPLGLLVASFALAGCTMPYDTEDEAEGVPECTPGVDGCPCPEDSRAIEGGCAPVDTILLDIQLTGSGSYEVGVPYPHGAWCLTAEDWLAGMRETHNVSFHEARDVDRGKVLWLQARDDAQFLASVEVTNRTTCNTLRADPWSIDPDPADETIDVFSEASVAATIYLRTAQGTCAEVRMFEGPVNGGWTTVPQRFNGQGCPEDG